MHAHVHVRTKAKANTVSGRVDLRVSRDHLVRFEAILKGLLEALLVPFNAMVFAHLRHLAGNRQERLGTRGES